VKTRRIIVWDDNDPFPMGKRVEEAFNRVIEFCPELRAESDKPSHRPPEQIAWRKVTNGEFNFQDLKTLEGYAEAVRARINGKYGGNTSDLAQSIFQASQNLTTVLTDTIVYVAENMGEEIE
jgi:hypothetical protein